MGKVNTKVDIQQLDPYHVTLQHFEVMRAIGKGSYGKVNAVVRRDTNEWYAMKTMNKASIIDNGAVRLVLRERLFWAIFDHPLIIKFHWSFSDATNLYAIVDLMHGGDMRFHLKKDHYFSLVRCKFYVAQLIEACNYIHKLGYIHRDIKPDNILFDINGNICLTDFNLTKKVGEGLNERAGTKRYMAPEIVRRDKYKFEADYWSIGVVLYEMITGNTPFTYEQLSSETDLSSALKLPDIITKSCKEVLIGLLDPDPTRRWGYRQIREASWFKKINFDELPAKTIQTPWKPSNKRSNVDGSHALDELMCKHEKFRSLSQSEQELFDGWDFHIDLDKNEDKLMDKNLSASESLTISSTTLSSDFDRNQFFESSSEDSFMNDKTNLKIKKISSNDVMLSKNRSNDFPRKGGLDMITEDGDDPDNLVVTLQERSKTTGKKKTRRSEENNNAKIKQKKVLNNNDNKIDIEKDKRDKKDKRKKNKIKEEEKNN